MLLHETFKLQRQVMFPQGMCFSSCGMQVQVAALTVELQSTASEVERASASAESVAAAAIEADKERAQSEQGLNERLKASEDTIEQLSVSSAITFITCRLVWVLCKIQSLVGNSSTKAGALAWSHPLNLCRSMM